MSVFVDTSALLAVMDADDSNHQRAAAAWRDLVATEELLVTSSYVVVELFALTQRRLGMDAVSALETDVMPILDVVWIGAEIHRRAIAAMFAAGSKKLSLSIVRPAGCRGGVSPPRCCVLPSTRRRDAARSAGETPAVPWF